MNNLFSKYSAAQKYGLTISKANAKIKTFADLTISPIIQGVNLSTNLITNFEGLQPHENLKTLILDNNPIVSFQGFPEKGKLPNLEYISLINCPISKLPNFRSLILALIGPALKTINGSEVTRNDLFLSLKYHESIVPFLTKGWIPRKPISITKDTFESINKISERQENDPFSLKAVSLLRTVGFTAIEIRSFLRRYFNPDSNLNDQRNINFYPTTRGRNNNSQVQKQQELINAMDAQLQALRNGNRNFNAYEDMLKTIGAPLIENAEIVHQMSKQFEENNEEQTETEKDNQQENTQTTDDPYEELRKAAIELIQEDENIDDSELIQKLYQLIDEEEDDPDKTNNSKEQNNPQQKEESNELKENQQKEQHQHEDFPSPEESNEPIENNENQEEERNENDQQIENTENQPQEEEQLNEPIDNNDNHEEEEQLNEPIKNTENQPQEEEQLNEPIDNNKNHDEETIEYIDNQEIHDQTKEQINNDENKQQHEGEENPKTTNQNEEQTEIEHKEKQEIENNSTQQIENSTDYLSKETQETQVNNNENPQIENHDQQEKLLDNTDQKEELPNNNMNEQKADNLTNLNQQNKDNQTEISENSNESDDLKPSETTEIDKNDSDQQNCDSQQEVQSNKQKDDSPNENVDVTKEIDSEIPNNEGQLNSNPPSEE